MKDKIEYFELMNLLMTRINGLVSRESATGLAVTIGELASRINHQPEGHGSDGSSLRGALSEYVNVRLVGALTRGVCTDRDLSRVGRELEMALVGHDDRSGMVGRIAASIDQVLEERGLTERLPKAPRYRTEGARLPATQSR